MSLLKDHSWEATHIVAIVVAIATLALVTHLTGAPRVDSPALNATSVSAARPAQVSTGSGAARAQQSDPREIIVGPSGISNRYTLLDVDRKPISSERDELIVKLRVKSLATDNLVSPFESNMLEIKSSGLPPINPSTVFNHPIPSGSSLNQDIVFRIPTSVSLKGMTLRIHYYNYQNEISLDQSPGKKYAIS
jgi:hypothetical protein